MSRKLAGVGSLRGQAMVLAVVTMSIILLTTLIVFNVHQLTSEKAKLQNTVDAVTYSMAVIEARDMNFAAYTNRAMVANQVGISQFVGMVSWFRYFWRLADNMVWIGRIMQGLSAIPFMQWLSAPAQLWTRVWSAIKSGANTGKRIIETISRTVITVLNGMNMVLSYSQAIYHYASIETTINTFINVLIQNDSSAGITAGGVVGFGVHEVMWLTQFTQWKGQPAPDDHIGRFADVTMASRDPWGIARGWSMGFIADPPGYRGPGETRADPFTMGAAGITMGMYLGLGKFGGSDLVLNDGDDGSSSPPDDPGEGEWEQECETPPSCPWKYHTSSWSLDGHSRSRTFYYYNCNNWRNTCSGRGCRTPRARCWARNQRVKDSCDTFRAEEIQACEDDKTENPVDDPTTPSEGTGSTSANDNQYHWTAVDTAGLQFEFLFDLDWTILKLHISIPFDIPFGWGAARAGSNKFKLGSWDNGSYGGISTNAPLGFAAAKFEWGRKPKIGTYGGLQKYMGVKDTAADNNEAPGILIEIRKPMSSVRTSNEAGIGYKGAASTVSGADRMYGEGGHPFDLSAQSVDYLFAVAKADAVFEHPEGGHGPADQKGNMFNPYWQARLIKTGDITIGGVPIPEKAIFYLMRTVAKLDL